MSAKFVNKTLPKVNTKRARKYRTRFLHNYLILLCFMCRYYLNHRYGHPPSSPESGWEPPVQVTNGTEIDQQFGWTPPVSSSTTSQPPLTENLFPTGIFCGILTTSVILMEFRRIRNKRAHKQLNDITNPNGERNQIIHTNHFIQNISLMGLHSTQKRTYYSYKTTQIEGNMLDFVRFSKCWIIEGSAEDTPEQDRLKILRTQWSLYPKIKAFGGAGDRNGTICYERQMAFLMIWLITFGFFFGGTI